MKILIVGGGGREHALAWKCSQSPLVTEVICAPGNAGTEQEQRIRNADIKSDDVPALVAFALEENIELTIVGPEGPLAAGLVDSFSSHGLKCFGPSQRAAMLESSKSFAKDFMGRHGIPTASYAAFTDLESALRYIDESKIPLVVKADGLASGKGVVVCQTREEARNAVRDMISGKAFGDAGIKVVVEDFLLGEEASFICLCMGDTAIPFASSQDHKARDEGDLGPNTGGMGAYSPAPVIDQPLNDRILRTVVLPTLNGMNDERRSYSGFLYVGLMIDEKGDPKVLEYNCRFGDPETQPIMMRLKTDLVSAVLQTMSGEGGSLSLEFDDKVALGVVLATQGYPGLYEEGLVVEGLSEEETDTKVFHSGTRNEGKRIVTCGGRVLCVVGLGDSVKAAQTKALKRIKGLKWDGMFYRADIGHRAINTE
jgi:phosphoribosylamine--glycine ligase